MSPPGDSSPLGRYDDDPGTTDMHEVRLLGLPVRIMAAGRAQHDELMHEFAMLAVADDDQLAALPRRLLDLVHLLGSRYGPVADRPDAVLDAALATGEPTVDLTFHVPSHVVTAADQLEAILAEADDYCRSEQLLTLARSELLVRFAHWYLDEFRRQVAGEPPQPWDGPVDPDT